MSIKEDFRKYREARRMAEIDKQRLEGAKQMTDTVRGSSTEWPYTQHPVTVTGRNAGEERAILARIAENKALCARVEEAIWRAPNEKIRCILTLHYVEGFSWENVAEIWAGDDVNAPGGTGVRKIAQRYLDRL